MDLHWSVIPVLLVHYYATHPLAQEYKHNIWRSRIVILFTWIWSIRLTHSYLRRENWQWGVREDWRFNEMRQQYGKHWWWISFFAVYVSQQVLFYSEPFFVLFWKFDERALMCKIEILQNYVFSSSLLALKNQKRCRTEVKRCLWYILPMKCVDGLCIPTRNMLCGTPKLLVLSFIPVC